MTLLKWLRNVSPFRGMPVDEKGKSSSVVSQSGETVQFYYNNSGTLTADAGQAAGVVIMAKLTFNNVLNVFGDALGKKGDTSLTFTSTALTAEKGYGDAPLTAGDFGITPEFIEALDTCDWTTRMAAIGAKLASGSYFVDYARGTIYAKKASTQTTLTATAYKYSSPVSSTGLSSSGANTYSLFSNLGANATLNVKSSAGNVYSLKCHNLNGAARYLQLHNTATVPSNPDVPVYSFLVPANSEIVIGTDFFGENGHNFATGIAFGFSTTEATYTGGTATDQMTYIHYK